MEHAEGHACLSEEQRSEIRQTDLTGHAEGHVCLSEKRRSEKGRLIGWGMQRDAHVSLKSDEVKYGRLI